MENPKEEQKQHLINMMKTDEELGLYEEPNLANMKCTCMRFEANCFSGACRNCGLPKKEEPKQTDEKGKPMTYWGGLEKPKQDKIMERFIANAKQEDTVEFELLQQIKFSLACNNEAIAIRLIEQFAFRLTQELYSKEDMKLAIKFGADGLYGYQMGEEGYDVNQIKRFLEQFKK